MTKKQETQALQSFTESLPKDTYLRPWLESILLEVEREIRSDFPVSPSIPQARAECEGLRMETKQLCARSIEEAQTKADRIIKDALERAQSIRSRARVQLADAMNTLAA
jgi:hypothetical protein